MTRSRDPRSAAQMMLRLILAAVAAVGLMGQAALADISRFAGDYAGTADIEMPNGDNNLRDMSVFIQEISGGFVVAWTSTTEKKDGRLKTKAYEIEFQPSDREGVYAAAMKRNVFGHTDQLDPMKGEPFVWARIIGDTLTVFSMFIASNGDYEMQQYDRTLTDGGLQLDFSSHRNGAPSRRISTFLKRK